MEPLSSFVPAWAKGKKRPDYEDHEFNSPEVAEAVGALLNGHDGERVRFGLELFTRGYLKSARAVLLSTWSHDHRAARATYLSQFCHALRETWGEDVEIAAAPNKLKIYRGQLTPRRFDGISWTLDRNIAEWFANRVHEETGQTSCVLSWNVQKRDLLACVSEYGRVNEAEVIACPVAVLFARAGGSIRRVRDYRPAPLKQHPGPFLNIEKTGCEATHGA